MQDRHPLFCLDCLTECICDELRACEQRVTERWEELRGWGESFAYKTGSDNGFDAGYRAGLDAAREAVAAIKDEHVGDEYKYERLALRVALAAIDALRGEQPPPLPPSVGVPTKPMWPLRGEL